jgi:hypothetical protein
VIQTLWSFRSIGNYCEKNDRCIDDGTNNRFLARGHSNVSAVFWCVDVSIPELIYLCTAKLSRDSITHIAFDEGCQRAAVASDCDVFTLEFHGSALPELKREYAVVC